MPDTSPRLLELENVYGWYGASRALHGASLGIRQGELTTLVGRNGAGKTTILRAIMGMLTRTEGMIAFNGGNLAGLPPEQIARSGIGYCPEERGIYASLSVQENLFLPPATGKGMSVEEIYTLFPNLKERRNSQGTKLSGGEQQMLAIARILRTGARLLLLDEPSEGLAPVIVQQIARLVEDLKSRGFTILLVEQNINFARAIADRYYVIENGRTIDELDNTEQSSGTLERYLGI
jgi:branched-chain amino acid transport system ATP-binding protein